MRVATLLVALALLWASAGRATAARAETQSLQAAWTAESAPNLFLVTLPESGERLTLGGEASRLPLPLVSGLLFHRHPGVLEKRRGLPPTAPAAAQFAAARLVGTVELRL